MPIDILRMGTAVRLACMEEGLQVSKLLPLGTCSVVYGESRYLVPGVTGKIYNGLYPAISNDTPNIGDKRDLVPLILFSVLRTPIRYQFPSLLLPCRRKDSSSEGRHQDILAAKTAPKITSFAVISNTAALR